MHVIEVPLCGRVVHRDDWVQQLACVSHPAQPVDAGGGLLSASDDSIGEFGEVAVDPVDQVRTVIKSECGTEVEGSVDALVELLGVLSVPRVDPVSLPGQPCRYIVLRGQGVASGPRHLSACCY